MGTSQRNKGSYHERWWVEFFKEKGAEARRQPLSGSMGGELGGDIKITTKFGSVIAESKYQSAGRGFSFLTKTHKEQPADIYLLKQRTGPAFVCLEANNPLVAKFIEWLAEEKF